MKRSLKVDSMGRVVLPAAWRRTMGVRPGSRIRVEWEPDSLRLRPEEAEPLMDRQGSVLVRGGDWVGDATDGVAADRDLRARRNWAL